MKRAFVFLVLGPVTVALAGLFVTAALGAPGAAAHLVAMVLFFLTLPVGAIVGTIDGCLSEVIPVGARAPVTAVMGAVTAWTLVYALIHWLTPGLSLLPVAVGGAVSMGLCSLLAHEYRGRQAFSPQAQALPQPADR